MQGSKQERAAAALQEVVSQLACPHCRQALRVERRGLACQEGHRYDMARNGYVNFLGRPAPDRYGAAGFAARTVLCRHGFLRPVYEWCAQQLAGWLRRDSVGSVGAVRLLDAGCGEGSPLMQVAAEARACGVPVRAVGIDIAKKAVHAAAREHPGNVWLVGDVSRPPLQEQTFDVLLNLFAPANYESFRRLLVPGGLILKAAPGPEHLKELRSLMAKTPRQDGRVETEVVDHFRRSTTEPAVSRWKGVFDLSWPGAKQALLRSSPLTWDAADGVRDSAETSSLREVTMDVVLLRGSCPLPGESKMNSRRL